MKSKTMPKIAYILKGYPRISETFILNEIHLLEKMGLSLRLFSVKEENEPKKHTVVERIQAEVTYSPEDTSMMDTDFGLWLRHNLLLYLRSHLWLMRRRPRLYWRTFCYALFGLSLRFPFGEWPSFKRGFIKDFFRAGFVAQQVLDDGNIQHLHGHFCHGSTTITMLVSYLTGIPFSFTAHAKDIYLPKLNPNGLLQTKIKRAEFVATCTDANRQFLEQLWPGDTPIYTIYHGLDTSLFAPASRTFLEHLPAQAGRSQGQSSPPLILSVGRFVEKKGFPYLIKACSILHERGIDFRCLIVGQKDKQSALVEEMIREARLTDHVHTQEGVTQEELRQIYVESDIFALACYVVNNGDRDGIPNVLAEAMAMELPVVSTNISGIPELVEDNVNGLLIAEKDAEALADCLAQMIQDPALRHRLGKAARETIAQIFDAQQTTVALYDLFLEQLEKRAVQSGDQVIVYSELVHNQDWARALR